MADPGGRPKVGPEGRLAIGRRRHQVVGPGLAEDTGVEAGHDVERPTCSNRRSRRTKSFMDRYGASRSSKDRVARGSAPFRWSSIKSAISCEPAARWAVISWTVQPWQAVSGEGGDASNVLTNLTPFVDPALDSFFTNGNGCILHPGSSGVWRFSDRRVLMMGSVARGHQPTEPRCPT
jgi:hypothetical protein